MSSTSRSKQEGASWDHLPVAVLGGVARHLGSNQPLRPTGTEVISQVCRSWSKICLVEPVVELDLEVHSIKAADWLATWLRRRARCLKSLRLAQLQDFLKESEDGASVTARLQQEREAMGGVLAALLETAKAAAAGGGTAAAAGAEAAAGGGEAAAGAAARRPLGLETLILRGSLACYPELSSLLAALPELRDVQLCADLNVAVDYSSVNALSAAPLGKQLTVLGGLSNLQALRVDDYLEDLGGGSWRDVLPATLTALTLVVDDAMVNGGHLSHLVNLRQLYLTDPGEHLGTGKLLQEPLTAVKGLRALPALQEVHIGERKVDWAVLLGLAPKLVSLKAVWSEPAPAPAPAPGPAPGPAPAPAPAQAQAQAQAGWDPLSRLTALTALQMRVSKEMVDGGWSLPPLPGLRRLQLAMTDESELLKKVLDQVGALPQLEELHLELWLVDQTHGGYLFYLPPLALPPSLTRLTSFTLQASWAREAENADGVLTFHSWYQVLAPLQQLRSLGIPQSMLACRRHNKLTGFTALTSLTLFAGRDGRKEELTFMEHDDAPLPALAVEKVADIGQQLQEVVVVGCRPEPLVGRALSRVVAPACRVRQLEYPVL